MGGKTKDSESEVPGETAEFEAELSPMASARAGFSAGVSMRRADGGPFLRGIEASLVGGNRGFRTAVCMVQWIRHALRV